MYLILYPYLLKVQRNVPNIISVPLKVQRNVPIRTFRKYNVMNLILYPYLLKVRGNVPNIISVPSESTR